MPKTTRAAQDHADRQRDAARQSNVLTRQQLVEHGTSLTQIQAQVEARRWRQLHAGVYYLSNGPLTRAAELWAAVLWAGEGAVVGFDSAAEVVALVPSRPVGSPVTVVVPWERRARTRPGIIVRRRRHLARMVRHGTPPSTSIEHTVLDLASEARSVRDAVGWITSAYRARLTTPDALATALRSRVRLRRRRLLETLLITVPDDTESPLEVEYHLRVERAHGLPRAQRQVRANLGGRRIRRDLDYDEYDTVVELDGRLGHDDPAHRFRDMDRDNETAVEGKRTLRYGAADIFGDPCRAARQVGGVLSQAGWRGKVRPCGSNCRALG
jgi:hypothetical protein